MVSVMKGGSKKNPARSVVGHLREGTARPHKGLLCWRVQMVLPCLDLPAPSNPYISDSRLAVAGEHMGRKHGVGRRQTFQQGVARIQDKPVGLLTHRQASHLATAGLRTTDHGLKRHGGRDIGVSSTGNHISLARVKALAVLQHHQFLGSVHAGMAV